MAMISPYGDPNAHGPLNMSLCFQRYKERVFLRAFPRPVSRKTPATIIQRQKLTDASDAYNLLSNRTKNFYIKRSIQQQRTSRNLFMSAHMKKYLPSINRPILAKSIEDIVIFTPAGLYVDEIKITIVNKYFELEDSCVAWWKLENLLAEIGVNWIEVGTVVWKSCKFGNGVWNDNAINYLRLTENFFDPNQYIYECWFETDYDVINGVPQDGAPYHGIFAWWHDYLNYIYTDFHSTSGLYCMIRVGGVYITYSCLDEALTFLAGTSHHVVFVYNREGIDGGDDKYRIYFDDSLIYNSTIAANNQVNTGATLYQNVVKGYTSVVAYPFVGTIDNPKIYNKTNQALIDAINGNTENEAWDFYVNYGYIFDSENIYFKEDEIITPDIQKIIISTPSGHPAHIPFRYLMRVEWKDTEDQLFNSVIRLPELIMGVGESVELFLSKDWSVYWDKEFHRLACTNQL